MEVSEASLAAIYRHGERAYPEECCGLVFSDGSVREACNIQNALHQQDPNRYPRDATRGYTFSVDDLKHMESSFSTDKPACIVYHSHPDVGAYFSDEDRNKALFGGIPIYPVSYLIVDIRQGRAVGASMFAHFDGNFQCVSLFAGLASPSKT